MEDYIYILLGVGWLAYSIYSQSKKKQKQRHHELSSEDDTDEDIPYKSSGSLFEQLFNENKVETAITEPYNIPYEPNEPIYKDVKENDESKFQLSRKEENNTKIESEDLMSENQSHDGYNDSQEIDFLEDFDLRRAVIYTEVLNNPRFQSY